MLVAETHFRWSPAERRAWKPRPRLKPSEWAEAHRRLPRSQTARPGRWQNANAPYLRGIMDIPEHPGVAEVAVMKAAQLGGSEAIRNLIGCWSDQDPDPMGIALPDKDKGRKIVARRIIPLYESTPVLRDKLTGRAADIQKGQLTLTDHTVHLMWAGSPASMSSDPMRRAFCDETDKFQEWAGQEADPVSLVRKRLRTYEDRARLICMSTPTTANGRIAVLFAASTVQLYYYVPCPHCGHWQRLLFPRIKWDKPEGLEGKKLAEHVEANGAAWYECEKCEGHIEEHQKPAMIRAGKWRTEDGSIDDAETVEQWPAGTRIGFQIPAWYALWVSFAQVAAEFINAKGRLDETFAFVTQTCGEPFEQRLKKTSAEAFQAKSAEATLPEGTIPRWAVRLIATIDTQHDHFWLVIRAWGPGLRSQRVYHSRVETFADLERLCWGTPWAVEAHAFPPRRCDLVWIDSGGTKMEEDAHSRTAEVYAWCQRVRLATPIKGFAKPKNGLYCWDGEGFIKRVGQQKAQKIRVWQLATHYWNDQLQSLIDDDGDSATKRPPLWQLNTRDDYEYNSHMSSVQKVARRQGRALVEEWIPAHRGSRIDYRDCEVYQVAAAYWLNVHLLPPDQEIERMRTEHQKHRAQVEMEVARRGPRRNPWAPTPIGGI